MLFLLASEGAKSLIDVKISIPDALIYSGIGFLIVFCVLAFLMGIIYLMAYIVRKVEKSGFEFGPWLKSLFKSKKKNEQKSSEEVKEITASAPVAPGSAGEIKLNDVPPQTAAMLMAIVADELKVPVNELKFISIKEIKE